MSMFLPLKRATLLVPSGPENDFHRKHLFIVLTNPSDIETGTKGVLMVSLSSIKAGLPYDASCILYPGDHPFIKTMSFVVYQRARIEEVENILRGVKSGKLVPREPIDSAAFARICKGLEESRLTPPKILKFYLTACGKR